MAYDHALADRIRGRVGTHPALTEQEMFGGIAFLIGGNMAVGVTGDELMVRVGKEGHASAIALPGARIFDLVTSRPMIGWLVVSRDGFLTDADFESWINRGVEYAESLPPK
jgi:hypothetical protein